jgi:endonuclease YncB( thermonuclease family)
MKENVKENIKPIIFVVIVLFLTAISAYPQLKFGGRVIEVVDGKTCVVELPSGRLTVVLQYIEVPDPEQPLHETVKNHLKSLVLDKRVELMPNGVVSTRTFGRLYVKGVDVSQQMLRDGAAWYSVTERSGLVDDEKIIYQDNENQAKAEKRGVWGVAGLKPVWEYRAEKEARQKQLERDALTRQTVVTNASRNKNLQREPVKSQIEMWADVGSASQYDQPFGVGGLRAGYDPLARVGHISTPSIYLDFPTAGFFKQVDSRLFYLYKGDKTKVEDGVYVIGFITTSKNYMFVNSNNLTVTADAERIALGKARRFYRQNGTSVSELLLYKVTRAQLVKFAKAKTVSLQLGAHKGAISNESLTLINNLLKAS